LALNDALRGIPAEFIGSGKAGILNQLGAVARAQRRWAQAEEFYQKALALKVELNDRHSQASTYHNLGTVAREQRRWAQAEEFYQKALALYVEFNDRYSQAVTYHQLGRVAQEQRRFTEAADLYLKALTLFAEFQDEHNGAIVLRSLARLRQASGDESLAGRVVDALGVSAQEAAKRLDQAAGTEDAEDTGEGTP
jgi:tetratricopeptide (TPR) repeat protein